MVGADSRFYIVQFTPSSLQFITHGNTAQTVVALRAMNTGNILVATAYTLEIRDVRLNRFFCQAVRGRLIDISVMRNNPVALVREDEEMVVQAFSEKLGYSKDVSRWNCSTSETGSIEVYGESLVVALKESSVLYFFRSDGVKIREVVLNKQPISIYLLNEEDALIATISGWEFFSGRKYPKHLKFLVNHEPHQEWNLSKDFQPFSADNYTTASREHNVTFGLNKDSIQDPLLSKTKDKAGFCYIYAKSKIFAFAEHGKYNCLVLALLHLQQCKDNNK